MKAFIKKIKILFSEKQSDIIIITGDYYDLQNQYKRLIKNKDISITSVSISEYHKSNGNLELIMAISYNYSPKS